MAFSYFCFVFHAVVFFTYYDKKYQLSAPIDWSIPGLLVIIPMLGFTWIAYVRRNRCLDMLSEFKSTTILLLNAFHNWMKPLPSLSEDALPSGQSHRALVSVGTIAGVHEAVESICDAMHEYFLPARFYSKRFPYFGYKSVMVGDVIRSSSVLPEDGQVTQLPSKFQTQSNDRFESGPGF